MNFVDLKKLSSQLLPETSVDPMELLSYLDTPALGELLATPPSSSSSAGSHPPRAPSSDDLLALFEWTKREIGMRDVNT